MSYPKHVQNQIIYAFVICLSDGYFKRKSIKNSNSNEHDALCFFSITIKLSLNLQRKILLILCPNDRIKSIDQMILDKNIIYNVLKNNDRSISKCNCGNCPNTITWCPDKMTCIFNFDDDSFRYSSDLNIYRLMSGTMGLAFSN
jgi:hypothetical protein